MTLKQALLQRFHGQKSFLEKLYAQSLCQSPILQKAPPIRIEAGDLQPAGPVQDTTRYKPGHRA